jgi:hypothetical protein
VIGGTVGFNASPTTSVVVTVNDGTTSVSTAAFTWTIALVNRAPVLAAIGDKTVAESAALTITASATDGDTDPLAYTTSALPSGATFNAGTGTFSWTPTYAQSGDYQVTFTVTDGTTPDSETITIRVTNANRAPAATADSYTTPEDQALTVAAATGVLANDTDADGDALTAAVLAGPTAAQGTLVLNSNGSFTFTPAANTNGPVTFTYTVADGKTGSATGTVTLTVTSVNDVPTITNIADQTSSGAAVGPLTVTVADVETAATALTLAATSSNTALVPVGNVVFGGSGVNRTVTVTPITGQSGSAVITVTVGDGASSAFDTFTVTVTAARTATTTSTPATSLTPSSYGQSVTFTSSVTGPGGTPTGTVTFYDNGVSLGTATLSGGSASLATTAVAAGTRSITAGYNGNAQFAPSTSATLTQTVTGIATTSALTLSSVMMQYSDRQTYEVTVNGASGGAPAQGVNFRIGTQTMNASPVPFVSMGGGTWKATLANHQLLETVANALNPNGTQKIVSAVYVGPNPGYTLPNPTSKALLLNKEDARVAYSGLTTVQTSGGASTATVTLSAKVRDISNTPDAAGDTAVGDIRMARVSFMNRATGAIIGTATVVADPADPNNGLATFNWNVDIGLNPSQTFQVGFVVNNYYTRNNAADNVSITVTK